MNAPNTAKGLEYARLGYPVFALQPNGKAPATPNGLKNATFDETIILEWSPHVNVGLLPPACVIVLDADSPGEAARLEFDYPALRFAPRCNTPRGGAHFYLKLPDGAIPPKTTVRVQGRDLDVRGLAKAYLVTEPSQVPTGTYRWVRPLVSPAALPVAPPELLELLTPPPLASNPPRPPETLKHDHANRYAAAALQAEHVFVASALPGTRNPALNRAAFNLGQLVGAGELERAEVEDALRGAASTCGLELGETEATLKSGLDSGIGRPREIPAPQAARRSAATETTKELLSAEDENNWKDRTPLPGLYPPVPELPAHLVPEPLRPWLSDIAERASLPLEFVTCPALVALSAVIGRSVGIYPKRRDDWLVVQNLWGGIVGKPGVMKSAAISEPTKPLRALAAKAREQFQKDAAEAEAKRAGLELEIAALKENEKRAAKSRYKP